MYWELIILFWCTEMKVLASYLLALLGGNTSPSADDLKGILSSGMVSILFFFS